MFPFMVIFCQFNVHKTVPSMLTLLVIPAYITFPLMLTLMYTHITVSPNAYFIVNSKFTLQNCPSQAHITGHFMITLQSLAYSHYCSLLCSHYCSLMLILLFPLLLILLFLSCSQFPLSLVTVPLLCLLFFLSSTTVLLMITFILLS